MQRTIIWGAVLALVTAAPLSARVHHTVSCTRIREALKTGKSGDEVAKELKVSSATVKRCTPPAKPSDTARHAAARK